VLSSVHNVPQTENEGHAVARFNMQADMDTVVYDVLLDSLTGPATMAHLHWGDPTETGGIAVDLTASISGNRIAGSFSMADGPDSLLTHMLEGGLYVNVHTAANPDGEIRGQVYRYWREGYSFDMTGAQEVPAVTTTAQGGGIASVDRDQTNAHIMYVTTAADVSMTHLHLGIAGENGGVIHDLTADLADNGVFAYWTAAEDFTVANSVQFRSDSLYANVHTAAVSSGEVRGQVHRGSSCDDFSSGIASLPTAEFLIYPQPAYDQLTVVTGPLGQPRMLLRDALGRSIGEEAVGTTYRHDRMELDISTLPPGLYLLTWTSFAGKGSARFVKE
jgi:hypothetical protein